MNQNIPPTIASQITGVPILAVYLTNISSGDALDKKILTTSSKANPRDRKKIKIAILPYRYFPRGKITAPKNSLQSISNLGDLHLKRHSKYEKIVRISELDEETTSSASTSSKFDGEATYEYSSRHIEQGHEWRRFANESCIWHILTEKIGQSKVLAMKRDGVWQVGKHFNNITATSIVIDETIGFSTSRDSCLLCFRNVDSEIIWLSMLSIGSAVILMMLSCQSRK